MKHDQDKPRWDLLPMGEINEVARVMTFGAGKYSKDNWKSVQDPQRYIAAAYRHLAAMQENEPLDSESGLPHIYHAITSLLMAGWIMKQPPQDRLAYARKEVLKAAYRITEERKNAPNKEK